MNGFKQFILRGNVVDLAVGVIIGATFTSVVSAFVKDILTPLLAAIGGQPDFSGIYFTINNSKFMVGDFVNALISFALTASVVYFLIVLPMNTLIARTRKEKPADPTTKRCLECLSEIPLKAKRCMYCTSLQKI
jgi:large conductance mechanosensitive channel